MGKFTKTANCFNELLIENEIAFACGPMFDGFKWSFLDPDLEGGDCVIHTGSYDNEEGMLESWGLPWDGNDVSVLRPEEMAHRIALVVNGKDKNAAYQPDEDAEHTYSLDDVLSSLGNMLGYLENNTRH